jgi:hypothetical protein
MGTMKAWVWYKNRTNKISGKTPLIFYKNMEMKKKGGRKKEVKTTV